MRTIQKEDINPLQSMTGIRQNPTFLQTEPSLQLDNFVLDFLTIWETIHSEAPKLTFDNIQNYSKSILNSITLPFYEKYKDHLTLEKYDSWLSAYSSIVINWVGKGRFVFPLRLITYEIINHSENLFEFYINKLKSKEIKGTTENLLSFIVPRLVNVAIPLAEVDLMILKAIQPLQDQSKDLYKGASNTKLANFVNTSSRTIMRHLRQIRFFQIAIPAHFLNMAKLGYETFLLSHFQSVPDELEPYALNSVDLSVSQFTLFQVPTTKTRVFLQLQEEFESTLFLKMGHRVHNWNLNGLTIGRNGWKIPPNFLYCEPATQIISPSPALSTSLLPDFNTFRRLTPADIKILEFITTRGTLKNRKALSKAVNVSEPETSKRLNEYHEHDIISNVHQFFNLGLDLSLSFFIVCPTDHDIPWVDQLLTFPSVDVFSAIDDTNTYLFGHVKLPSKWYKDFTRKISRLKRELPGLKIYYTAEVPSIPKWNLSLSESYF